MSANPPRTASPPTVPPTAAGCHAARLEEVGRRAGEYLEKSRAANTRRAYRADWRDFEAWCAKYRRPALPAAPGTVAYYLADRSRALKTSTLRRRLATIAEAHRAAGLDPPTAAAEVRLVWAGIRRENGSRPDHVKPVLTRHLRSMVAALPDSLLGARDRALLLLGFAGAFRRSELVGLEVADLESTDEGLVVAVRRSKTDQAGAGRTVGIPFGGRPETCPVRAVQAWLDRSGTDAGPLFRAVNKHGQVSAARLSDRAVAEVVKRTLLAAGLSPQRYAGHSLRAGLITQAAMEGVPERTIQGQSGHRSLEVLRRFIRDGNLFRENAATKVGL
ncbi:MAG: tyrosine-type recombinase/integrase [Gemmataceae bacterium]|nr:tyrosine-type recombinase/integrase [Gemmataceae bacterium]